MKATWKYLLVGKVFLQGMLNGDFPESLPILPMQS